MLCYLNPQIFKSTKFYDFFSQWLSLSHLRYMLYGAYGSRQVVLVACCLGPRQKQFCGRHRTRSEYGVLYCGTDTGQRYMATNRAVENNSPNVIRMLTPYSVYSARYIATIKLPLRL
jgi:hypothetical protein